MPVIRRFCTYVSGNSVELDPCVWNNFRTDTCTFDEAKFDTWPRSWVQVDRCNSWKSVLQGGVSLRPIKPVTNESDCQIVYID